MVLTSSLHPSEEGDVFMEDEDQFEEDSCGLEDVGQSEPHLPGASIVSNRVHRLVSQRSLPR